MAVKSDNKDKSKAKSDESNREEVITRKEEEEKKEEEGAPEVNEGNDDVDFTDEEDPNIWRCSCGEEFKIFGPQVTKHQSVASDEDGYIHEVRLYNKETGEVLADGVKEALSLGLIKPSPYRRPKTGRETDRQKKRISAAGARGKGSLTEGRPYHASGAFVEKFVVHTGELDARLLLLYEMTLQKFGWDRDNYTRENWLEDVITQFYAEHAEDFDFKQMAYQYVEERVHGGKLKTVTKT